MGSASLAKVTVVSPRSDYREVVKLLGVFSEFHPLEEKESAFDPAVQALVVRAVGVYARADETIRDLQIQPGPGTLDVVFRGVKVNREEYDASDWNDLITRAEVTLQPIAERVKAAKADLQNVSKQEGDAKAFCDALRLVSGLTFDLGTANEMERVKIVLTILDSESLPELRNSLPGVILQSQSLSEGKSLVLLASSPSESSRVAKAMKALELKPLVLPEGLPQNPADAFRKLDEQYQSAKKERIRIEADLERMKIENQDNLLAIKELSELARNALDEARGAGKLKRIATISGYVPARRLDEFKSTFGKWMVYSEPAVSGHEVPTLLENRGPLRHFEVITKEQGTPGSHEVDPTPVISFVFPIFFGIMFGDLGHGIVLTLFALLLRQRGTGSIKQWGNIFLAAGISACAVGAIVGEFFGFPLYETLHIPGSALLDIVTRSAGQASLSQSGLNLALEIAILIGVAHLTTALSLDVVQAVKGHEKVELVTEKLPALSMYIFGVGFGISFIGAHYSFQVLSSTGPAPLLGVPNSQLGAVSIAGVLASILVLLTGKGVAVMTGKLHEGTAGSAFGNGAIEVFERISGYMANTISYVRLAIMLMIHAELLLVVNMLLNLPLFVAAPMMFIFNILIIVFEVLIVYIQDLRLHVYEFFTKFYKGTGTPFRKILPDGVRVKIKWR